VKAAEMIGLIYLNGGEGISKKEKKAIEIFEWTSKQGSQLSKQWLTKQKPHKSNYILGLHF